MRALVLASVILSLGILQAEEQVLIDDGFEDGNRDASGYPDSAVWMAGGATDAETQVEPGRLDFEVPAEGRPGMTGRGLVALLLPDGSPVTLEQGRSLTAEITYRFENENADDWGLRVLFLSVGGALPGADVEGFNSAVTATWTGVGARAGMGASNEKRRAVIKRSEGNGNFLNVGSFKNLSAPVRQDDGTEPGVSHTATLKVQLLSPGLLQISSTLGGEWIVADDGDDPTTAFDAIGFFATRPAGRISVERVRVVLQSP